MIRLSYFKRSRWIDVIFFTHVRFIIVELCVLNYILIVNLHGLSKDLWLRLINIHSEYKFQIHQASLYSIDFVQWLPWKEFDYFLFTPSVRTNRSLIAAVTWICCALILPLCLFVMYDGKVYELKGRKVREVQDEEHFLEMFSFVFFVHLVTYLL